MLKLKGETYDGEIIKFELSEVLDETVGDTWIKEDTIILAEDPCKVLLEKIRIRLRDAVYSDNEELIERVLDEIELELENN